MDNILYYATLDTNGKVVNIAEESTGKIRCSPNFIPIGSFDTTLIGKYYYNGTFVSEAQRNLELMKTVDGAGSGLDADMVDGKPIDVGTGLATIDYVSDTTATKENNLVHTNGNESISGVKTFNSPIVGDVKFNRYMTNSGGVKWVKVCNLSKNCLYADITVFRYGHYLFISVGESNLYMKYILKVTTGVSAVKMGVLADGSRDVWFKLAGYFSPYVNIRAYRYTEMTPSYITNGDNTGYDTFPESDYTSVIDATDVDATS